MANEIKDNGFHKWITDPFGPWVCETCGVWSITKGQLQRNSARFENKPERKIIIRDGTTAAD